MGHYITTADVSAWWREISEGLTRKAITTDQVSGWIDDAERLVDGKVGKRYALPFASPPPLVVACSKWLFRYFWQEWAHTPKSDDEEIPGHFKSYDRIIALLDEIASGQMPLVGNDGVAIDPADGVIDSIRSNFQDTDPIFSMKDAYDQEIPDPYGDNEPE